MGEGGVVMKSKKVILLGFILGVGSLFLGACGFPSAFVSAVALLNEVENTTLDAVEESKIIVTLKEDSDVYAGPGTEYSFKGNLEEGRRIDSAPQKQWQDSTLLLGDALLRS